MDESPGTTEPAMDTKKLTEKQLRFCEGILKGKPASVAYREAGYASKGNAAEVCASQLLRNAKVQAHLGKRRKAREKRTDISLEKVERYLARVINTPVGMVDETSLLAEEVTYTQGPNGSSKKVKMFSKDRAISHLRALKGWDATKEVKIDASDPLLALIQHIRSR